MIYLLGGAPRTGKTRLARAFLAHTGTPFFSLDFLMMGFINGLPEYGVASETDELLIASQLGPVVRAMVAAMVEEEIDYLLEGAQIHPTLTRELQDAFPGQVRACFLGCADVDPQVKFAEIRRFGGGPDDWLRSFSDEIVFEEIERIRSLSQRLRDLCQQHRLEYIETSDDLPATTARVLEYLLEGDS